MNKYAGQKESHVNSKQNLSVWNILVLMFPWCMLQWSKPSFKPDFKCILVQQRLLQMWFSLQNQVTPFIHYKCSWENTGNIKHHMAQCAYKSSMSPNTLQSQPISNMNVIRIVIFLCITLNVSQTQSELFLSLLSIVLSWLQTLQRLSCSFW